MKMRNVAVFGLAGILLMGLNACFAATAAVSAKPAKQIVCKPMTVKPQNQAVLLSGSAQTGSMYLIHNISQKSIWLDHADKRASASAGWSSYLRPGNWAALFLNRKDFTLSCSVISPGKVETLNCAEALSLCEPQSLTLKSNHKNSYWVVEDKSWDDMIKAFAKKGVN